MLPVSGVDNLCCFSVLYTEWSDDLVNCQSGFCFLLLVDHAVQCVELENTGFVLYRRLHSALNALCIALSDSSIAKRSSAVESLHGSNVASSASPCADENRCLHRYY